MVCDRRQLSQALTNVVKNGVEAIEGRRNRGEHSIAGDRIELKLHQEDDSLIIDVFDTGIGLPEDRERLTEPYMGPMFRATVVPILNAYTWLTGKESETNSAVLMMGRQQHCFSSRRAETQLGYRNRPFAETLADTWACG